MICFYVLRDLKYIIASQSNDIVYKSSTYLHFWNLRIRNPTYPEIQALWLVEQQQQRLNSLNGPFWQCKNVNVWANISWDITANFDFS